MTGILRGILLGASILGGLMPSMAEEKATSPISKLVLVSTLANGNKANGYTGGYGFIDANQIILWSQAKNFPDPVANGDQMYLKNLKTNVLRVLTTSASGEASNGFNQFPSFNADHSLMSFTTGGNNLFTNDTNNQPDIVVKNLKSGAVVSASVNSKGEQSNGWSEGSKLSPDGSRVYFLSGGTNLVNGDTNGFWDLFERNLKTKTTRIMSLTAKGKPANEGAATVSVMPDGKSIIFTSYASNLIAKDTNKFSDVFVKNLSTGALTLISKTSDGKQIVGGNTYEYGVAPDGNQVLLLSYGTNLPGKSGDKISQIYVKNIKTGKVTLVSSTSAGVSGNGESFRPVFSNDGTKVLFMSDSTNLSGRKTPDFYDLYVKDLATGVLIRASSTLSGKLANGNVGHYPSFSPDGKSVLYESTSTNLVAKDTDDVTDAYIATLR